MLPVISSPSRTHAVPSARMMRVWNGDQLSRSIRAGIRLRMVSDPEAMTGGEATACAISGK